MKKLEEYPHISPQSYPCWGAIKLLKSTPMLFLITQNVKKIFSLYISYKIQNLYWTPWIIRTEREGPRQIFCKL